MRRVLSISIMFLFVSICSGEMIGDFAPIKLGNSWEYCFLDSSISVGVTDWVDSGIIQLTITDIIQNGNDSLIIFNCKVSGNRNTTMPISRNYLDTVIVTKDSVKAFHYLFSFGHYPLWKTHSINIDNLKSGNYNNENVYYYGEPNKNADRYDSRDSYCYLQNVGLYQSNTYFWGATTLRYQSLKLVSFNNIHSALPIMNNKKHTNNTNDRNWKNKIILSNINNSNGKIMLNGKKLLTEKHLSSQAIVKIIN